MRSDCGISREDDFYSLAERLDYASADALADLRTHCRNSSAAPETVSLQRGLLDATQVEIVCTLMQPRDTIPGYEIIDVLGRGGMGVVFRARQLNLDRVVALKTVLVSRMGAVSAVSRFEQEARMVAQLRHPNIVGGYDFGRHEGRVFFAMELVDGIEAADLIKSSGPLDESLAWCIARQTAAGLAHAANHAVVHRDIKPGNLLLIEPPEGMQFPPGMPMVKIADFGLAILTETVDDRTHLTSDNATVGSPYYMAPEQFENSEVSSAADIYSLGVTAFHMLAGKTPFAGSSITKIMAAKLSGQTISLRSVRPGLSDGTYELVADLMAHKPEDRPSGYGELITRIDQLCPELSGPGVISEYGSTAQVKTYSSEDTAGLETKVFASRKKPVDVDTEETPSRSRVSRSQFLLGGMIVLGSVFIAVMWNTRNQRPTVPTPVRMTDAGLAVLLFNGENTAGWQQRKGNWIVPRLSATLNGTNGLLARPLFVKVDGQAQELVNYRLRLVVSRGKAESVAVHFGFVQVEGRNGHRYVLMQNEQGFQVGERDSDTGDFLPLQHIPARALTGAAEVVLEAQPGGWFVSINEKPLAALLRRPAGELPEVRLGATGGPGEFSEISVTQLVVASSAE